MIKRIFVLIIKFYQKFISPLKPPSCRYYPTCSSYAVTAITKFGAFKGGFLAIRRILKCNPFNYGGVDYVPDSFSFREYFKEKYKNIKLKIKK